MAAELVGEGRRDRWRRGQYCINMRARVSENEKTEKLRQEGGKTRGPLASNCSAGLWGTSLLGPLRGQRRTMPRRAADVALHGTLMFPDGIYKSSFRGSSNLAVLVRLHIGEESLLDVLRHCHAK